MTTMHLGMHVRDDKLMGGEIYESEGVVGAKVIKE